MWLFAWWGLHSVSHLGASSPPLMVPLDCPPPLGVTVVLRPLPPLKPHFILPVPLLLVDPRRGQEAIFDEPYVSGSVLLFI